MGNCGSHDALKNGGGLSLKKAGPFRVDGPVANGSVKNRIEYVTSHPQGVGRGLGKYDSTEQRIACMKKNASAVQAAWVSSKRTSAI